MAYDNPRDFVGYGQNSPDPKWPGDARVAVNFVINYEEGSEPNYLDGDGKSEAALTEATGVPNPPGSRDLAAESMFEYGSRVGVWRALRQFQERELPVTFFGCAMALERNPDIAEAIRAGGYDVCSHGWRWIEHFHLSEEEERDHIRRAIASIERTTGERPLGWYCRHGPSENTRRLVVEEGGFLYDSDAYNDELPYWVDVGGHQQLVVPYTMVNNDSKFSRGWFSTSDDFFTHVRDAFDMLYEEGATHPKMMSVGLHTRLIGHPARAMGLRRVLDHMMQFKDVWICRRIDIARHWHENHPPKAGM